MLNGEWLDLELASVDAVLCRWGYMLMADPSAALRETRRVLRSGGRVSLAVWDERELNPWSAIPNRVLAEHGLIEPPDARRARSVLARRHRASCASCSRRPASARSGSTRSTSPAARPTSTAGGRRQLDLSVTTRRAFEKADEEQTMAVEAEIAERFAPYTDASGELAVPGRTHVAVAEA